ncbi:MAG: alpha/beta fold hydrolase [Actinomycetota bacterium]
MDNVEQEEGTAVPPGKGAAAPKLKKRAMVSLVVGLAVAALGILGAALLTFPDVSIRRVGFSTEGFESPARKVSGLLITPDNPVARPTPAVVFCHGFTQSKEAYFEPARELARRGVVVLDIDLRGHGSTGGAADQNYSEAMDALGAVSCLRSLPGVDPDRIAITGHSRGGVTSTRAGILQPDEEIKAVAAVYSSTSVRGALERQYGGADGFIGRLWSHLAVSHAFDVHSEADVDDRDFADTITADRPPNFLLVIGSNDELTSVEEQEKVVALAAGLPRVVPGRTYGSFEDGTARKFVVTKDTHFSEMTSPAVWTAVYSWIFQAFDLKAPAPATRTPVARALFQAMVMLGFLLVALGCLYAGRYALGEGRKAWHPEPTPGRKKDYSLVAIACLLCYLAASLAALPLTGALGLDAFVPFSSLPLILGPDLLAGVAAGQVLVMLPAFALLALLERRWKLAPASVWPRPSAWMKRGRGEEEPETLGAGAVAFVGLVPFTVFALLYSPTAYALFLPRGVPISIGWFLVLAGVTAAYLYVSGHFFHAFLLPRWTDLETRRRRVTYVLAEAGVRGVGLAVAFIPAALNPFLLIGGIVPHARVPLVPVVAVIGFVAFIPASVLTLFFRRRGYGVASSSLLMGLAFAWIFSTQVAVRFF